MYFHSERSHLISSAQRMGSGCSWGVILIYMFLLVDKFHYFFCQLATVAVCHINGKAIAAVATIIYPQGVGYGEAATSAAIVMIYTAYGRQRNTFMSPHKAVCTVNDNVITLYCYGLLGVE